MTEEQVMYAALDAWASLLVYENLSERAPQGASGDTPSKTERRTSTRERPRADSGEADGWDQQVVTPALPSERQTALMPAKADAHRLHMELGWSGIEIAEAKGVMASTANGYLADAIRAGKAYRLGALGLKKKTLAAVMLALDAHRNSSPEVTSATATNAALGQSDPLEPVRELMNEGGGLRERQLRARSPGTDGVALEHAREVKREFVMSSWLVVLDLQCLWN